MLRLYAQYERHYCILTEGQNGLLAMFWTLGPPTVFITLTAIGQIYSVVLLFGVIVIFGKLVTVFLIMFVYFRVNHMRKFVLETEILGSCKKQIRQFILIKIKELMRHSISHETTRIIKLAKPAD